MQQGVLPDSVLLGWRLPPVEHQYPMTNEEEVLLFSTYFPAGLGLPASDFLRGVLAFYEIELTHLAANSLLQISIFVHLCEAFLGIDPHLGLWRHLY
jgi:hypothetical protein